MPPRIQIAFSNFLFLNTSDSATRLMLEFDNSFLESNNSVLHFGNCFLERINFGNSFLERINFGNSFLERINSGHSFLERINSGNSFLERINFLLEFGNFFLECINSENRSLEFTNSILAFIHVFVGRHNFNLLIHNHVLEYTSTILTLPQPAMERSCVSFQFNIYQENSSPLYSSIMAEIMAAGALDAFMAFCYHVYQTPNIKVSFLLILAAIWQNNVWQHIQMRLDVLDLATTFSPGTQHHETILTKYLWHQ